VFQDDLMNFERVKMPGRLRLDPAARSLTLHFTPATASAMRFRSVELVPVPALAAIEREAERARKTRASTDWLVKAGYGVMFHWTGRSQPRNGPAKSYAEAVAEFDVAAFGRMVEETGAGYVIFTVNHADPHCPAPIASWERAHPGQTTQRDLIGEIADDLGKRKIRLMLYIASHTLGGLGKSSAKEYWSIHEQVLSEFGRRYGARVAGYWFDGWYQTLERYPELSLDSLRRWVKTGNPQRLVAYNSWLYPLESERQEYWAGEVAGLVKPPDSRYMTSGPAKGLQYQTLLIADAPWVHSKPDSEMEPLRFRDEQLVTFIQETMAKQGVVTINLGVFQDGSIGREAASQMTVVRRAVRGK
jgi:alpha-L-fucosidase